MHNDDPVIYYDYKVSEGLLLDMKMHAPNVQLLEPSRLDYNYGHPGYKKKFPHFDWDKYDPDYDKQFP